MNIVHVSTAGKPATITFYNGTYGKSRTYAICTPLRSSRVHRLTSKMGVMGTDWNGIQHKFTCIRYRKNPKYQMVDTGECVPQYTFDPKPDEQLRLF